MHELTDFTDLVGDLVDLVGDLPDDLVGDLLICEFSETCDAASASRLFVDLF